MSEPDRLNSGAYERLTRCGGATIKVDSLGADGDGDGDWEGASGSIRAWRETFTFSNIPFSSSARSNTIFDKTCSANMSAEAPSTQSPQWLLDLNAATQSKPKHGALPDPPGYSPPNALQSNRSKNAKSVTTRKPPSTEEMDTLKLKKAWEMAIAPAKQLPMNAFGMYMTGNSLQIFSIMMVFMLFKGPIQALFNIQSTFQRLESDGNKQQMILVKAAYVGCNLLALALGIWKVNGMGLLP